MTSSDFRWTIKHVYENQLDGRVEHFERERVCEDNKCNVMLFPTRALARAFAKQQHGYMTHRPDLKAEPFGWRMPQVVKVKVTVSEEG